MSEPYYTLERTAEFGNYSDASSHASTPELLELGFDSELFPNPFPRLDFLQTAYFRAARQAEWVVAAIAAQQAQNLHRRVWSAPEVTLEWGIRTRTALVAAIIATSNCAEVTFRPESACLVA